MVAMPAKVIVTEPMTCNAIAPTAQLSRPCWSKVVSSAEKVENVVSPPQKPVMMKRRHSGASAEYVAKNAIARPMT